MKMKSRIILIASVVVGGALFTAGYGAQLDALSDREINRLIDDLQGLDRFVVGFHPTAHVDQFLADEAPPKFAGGVLGSRAPTMFGPMKELVKCGPKALPVLLNHLEDQRPTKLIIKKEGVITWVRYTNRYNNRPLGIDPSFKIVEEYGDLPYTVTVGDVCLVIIGQITNRSQVGVRYAPTGGVEVCSVGRYPEIVREATADWTGVGPDQLYAHLITDLLDESAEASDSSALKRVRAYFPDKEKDAQTALKKTPKVVDPMPISMPPAAVVPSH